ncbi:dihydroorotase [Ferroplasma sp.]|uniref:dihydroorotase n=1 Tax=Ferroplasma sp. TaxID=2591003 RepID=UPI00307E86DF
MHDSVYSGKFFFQNTFQELDVAVENGIITDIKKHINGKRKLLKNAIIPAGTDTHVHFRDPGETEKEDFSTGSISAIYGGTTTVFDMPNNRIKIDNYSAYMDKLEIVRRKAFCDFGLYSNFTGSNANIISKESSGIKIYMGETTNAGGIGNITEESLASIEKMGIPVVFHAEDGECLKNHAGLARNLKEYSSIRPVECEDIAIKKAENMKFSKGIITHITHDVNTPYIKEVTPHHTLLNTDMPLGPYGKVNPPLRSKDLQESLLNGLINGKFNTVSSDHAPHTQNDKIDFEYAKSGIIGVETRIPLMLALVHKKILPFDIFYKTCILNPAKLFNLKKGEIKIGNYADFMSVDFSSMNRIDDYKLHSKNPGSPFNGFDAIFPDYVILRGETVIDQKELTGSRTGKYVNDLR